MGKALFVSHEWVSKMHPDPEFKQFQILQNALRNVVSGLIHVDLDIGTELMFGGSRYLDLGAEAHTQLLSIWYDYFSCPQLQIVQQGGTGGDLDKAIDSIPAYVAKFSFFCVWIRYYAFTCSCFTCSWVLLQNRPSAAQTQRRNASSLRLGGGALPRLSLRCTRRLPPKDTSHFHQPETRCDSEMRSPNSSSKAMQTLNLTSSPQTLTSRTLKP